MAAYSLIEHLDEAEGDERIPLLVNLSAWEAQDNFEAFLVDYLCSSVGYQVRQPAVARAFISSRRYSLILDGLDEIPARLRPNFSECLDEFVRGLPSEVAVVVTCRTQEYEELLAGHPTGLGLVQAVEIHPLTDQQIDSAFVELARFDNNGWETFLAQRHLLAYQRVRHLLSNPLFLNLAIVGHIRPHQLLHCDTEQELQDLVLEKYLDRTLTDQRQYAPEDARRYLAWIARFLSGAEVSPFGLKTPDSTVFDLAVLTPPEPPRRYRLFEALSAGWVGAVVLGLLGGLVEAQNWGLVRGLVVGLGFGLVGALLGWVPYERSAVSSRLTLVWPTTRQQAPDFLVRIGRGLVRGLTVGLQFGLIGGLILGLEQFSKWLTFRKPPISASCSGSGRSPEVVPPPAAGIIHFEKCFSRGADRVASDRQGWDTGQYDWFGADLGLGLWVGLGTGCRADRGAG